MTIDPLSPIPPVGERPKKQTAMTPEQLDAFLNESNPEQERTRLGIVASLMKNGCPHLTPAPLPIPSCAVQPSRLT